MPLMAQNASNKKKQKEVAIKELIKSGNYKIEVSIAYPRGGKSVPLTSSYDLEIRNDSVISHLPFYGRAYSIPYGGGDGLNFKAPLDEYEVEYNPKKEKYEVKLGARTNEDTFRFNLEIFFNGSSRIDVTMQNRESISYSGEIELLPL
ncbi:DUF4251 domain-containing protein [Bacteroides sp. 51]|uniref:DUF4251 domain-containing protein n=1 Tax=Bacteroides sp. 51 TaxID=2302938 RepID=UPI001EF2151A|nr:DUF4251 domain-containing protein [Bacteroides sp. 51]